MPQLMFVHCSLTMSQTPSTETRPLQRRRQLAMLMFYISRSFFLSSWVPSILLNLFALPCLGVFTDMLVNSKQLSSRSLKKKRIIWLHYYGSCCLTITPTVPGNWSSVEIGRASLFLMGGGGCCLRTSSLVCHQIPLNRRIISTV